MTEFTYDIKAVLEDVKSSFNGSSVGLYHCDFPPEDHLSPDEMLALTHRVEMRLFELGVPSAFWSWTPDQYLLQVPDVDGAGVLFDFSIDGHRCLVTASLWELEDGFDCDGGQLYLLPAHLSGESIAFPDDGENALEVGSLLSVTPNSPSSGLTDTNA